MSQLGLPPTTLSSSLIDCISNNYKSDLLFLCPSILISKRNEKERMSVHEKCKGKKKRWWGLGSSCFGDSNVFEFDGTSTNTGRKPVRKRAWSRLGKRKKTVPVEIAGDAMDCEMKRSASDGIQENNCNGQNKPEEFQVQNKSQKQQESISTNKTMNDDSKLPVQRRASRCDFLSKSAPLYSMLDPVQTQTQIKTQVRTSHHNSPETSQHSTPEISSPSRVNTARRPTGESDPSKLLPLISVAVTLVVLFGRGFAIFCMCVYFYVISKFKSESAETKTQTKKENEEVDLDSEKHKKMVVLRGFLERAKKNPGTSLRSSSTR